VGVSQTKRAQAFDNTFAPNAQVNIVITTSEDPCNIHGLITDLMVGSLGAGINFGYWAMLLIPTRQTNIPTLNTTTINSEDFNALIWMLGTWMCDDPSGIAHIGGAPRTSRNCPRGGRLVLIVSNSVLSGSSVRIHGTASWFEIIK